MKKQYVTFLQIILIVFLTVSFSHGDEGRQYEKYTAEITDLKERTENGGRIFTIDAKVLEGPYENKIVRFEHLPIEGTRFDVSLKQGMSIIVSVQLLNDSIDRVSLYDIERRGTLKILAVIFISFLVVFGGFRGIRAAFSLLLTLSLVLFCLIPLILNEFNPLFASILTASLAIFINFILISGFSRKSFCAIVSTIGGTVIAGLFAYYFGNLMALTGLSEDTIQTFVSYTDVQIDYRGLLFSGIIIGAIGAIMDVSMSVVSFIFEMKDQYPRTTPQSLFKSGLNVGKDIMATMANTLILAYAGASIPIFLLFSTMDISFVDAINIEYISEEILRSLCGSIGLILTIPLSSFIASIKA